MSLRFSIRVLDHLSHRDYKPVTLHELARQLRVAAEDFDEFRDTLTEMENAEHLEKGDDDRYRLPDFASEVEGTYKQNARGFGFVEPDHPTRHGGLFIPIGANGDAVSGDRVRARVNRTKRGIDVAKGPSGVIIEVVERGRREFAGTLTQRGKQWIVEPDGRALREKIVVRDPFAKNAKAGDKVVIEITQYPEAGVLGEGVIVRVLGEAGRPDVETQSVIATHGLRQEFPDEVVEDARRAARSFEAEAHGPWPDREDLTGQFIFTIDPPDAKDFDDAISIVHDATTGRWTLGVHIADVSHFVKSGSPLDEEGRERGNSVYLPRLVLPMLPETLSNGVCSLQEGVIRFTKSAFIEFDERGRVESQRLANTVIKSAKRLTYLEAQALIDGKPEEAAKHTRTEPTYSDELVEALKRGDRLARILQKRRKSDGMISLELPQVELVFDKDGHVVDATPEDNAYTHTLIEMFMVEANEALARTFADLDLPLIRRIHPEPSFGDIESLRLYARLVKWRLPDEPTRKDMQALIEATRGTPAARAIHFAVLRTFTKATYSPALIGHFALASEHYTHFTSPIRRYPDLTVHRAMAAFLDETENGRKPPGGKARRSMRQRLADDERVLNEGDLLLLGRHCSDTEVAAAEAEQELRSFLVLQFLRDKHLGDEFDGLVTGVTGNAVFISLQRFLIDGMVKVVDLSAASSGRADRWTLNEATARLVAGRSGMSIGLGDLVTVQIVAINLSDRTMELRVTKFAPSSSLGAEAGPGPAGRDRDAANLSRGKGGSSSGAKRLHGYKKGFKQGRRGKRG